MRKYILTSFVALTLFFSGFAGASIHKTEAASLGATASTIAQKHIGVPYKWGGTSPKGFDCSGLVGYSFRQAGKSLPRTAADMFRTGMFISKSWLQKGDLVFFSTYKAGISHVGIYIGANRFVHASNHGVRIDSLCNSYWSKAYCGSKRV